MIEMTEEAACWRLKAIRDRASDKPTYVALDLAISKLNNTARWIPKDSSGWIIYECSACEGISPNSAQWDFCPRCGARMGGDKCPEDVKERMSKICGT